MQITIDPEKGIPLYLQLQEEIRYLIATGGLLPGSRLPSTRTLAKQLAVAPQTILQAYQRLERDGLVVSHRGRGTVVAALEVDAVRPTMLRNALAAPIREAQQRGFSLDEIQREIRQLYQQAAATDIHVCVVDRYAELAVAYSQQLEGALGDLPVRLSHHSVDHESDGAARSGLSGCSWLFVSLYSLPELKRVLPPEDTRIVSFSITYTREVLARIANIPSDVAVGIVGVRAEYVHTLRRVLHLDGVQRPEVASALVSDPGQVDRVVRQSQVVLYTPPCRAAVCRLASVAQELLEVAPVIADESITKIRGFLTDRSIQETLRHPDPADVFVPSGSESEGTIPLAK